MSPSKPDPVREALEAAAGRRAPAGVDASLLAWAQDIAEARRAILASEPCPPAVLRRVQGIPAARSHGAAATLLHLVFDSWQDLAPATRGGRPPRALRFESEDQALDLRLVREDDGGTLVQVATEPEQPGLLASVEVPGSKRPVVGMLDEAGAGQIRLPATAREVIVTVGDGDRPLLRSPRVSLE